MHDVEHINNLYAAWTLVIAIGGAHVIALLAFAKHQRATAMELAAAQCELAKLRATQNAGQFVLDALMTMRCECGRHVDSHDTRSIEEVRAAEQRWIKRNAVLEEKLRVVRETVR